MASLLFKLRVAALVAGLLVVLQRAAAKRVYAPSGAGFAPAAASFVLCRDVLASSRGDGSVRFAWYNSRSLHYRIALPLEHGHGVMLSTGWEATVASVLATRMRWGLRTDAAG